MPKECKVSFCHKNVVARGWCATHYACWRRTGDPIPPSKQLTARTCYAKGCNRRIEKYLLCHKHLQRLVKYGELEPSRQRYSCDGLVNRYPTEHGAWHSAKERCLNKNNKQFKNYGGRGIKICDAWQGAYGFKNFLDDMGPKPSNDKESNGRSVWTLDRIDYNGDYCPENCRWATREMQNNNRRTVIVVDYNGCSRTLSEWGKFYGVSAGMLRQRYKKGLRGDKLFSRPKRK